MEIELIPTKLPHCALIACSAIIMLMTWWLTEKSAASIELPRWQFWLRRTCAFGTLGISIDLAAIALGITPYFLGKSS